MRHTPNVLPYSRRKHRPDTSNASNTSRLQFLHRPAPPLSGLAPPSPSPAGGLVPPPNGNSTVRNLTSTVRNPTSTVWHLTSTVRSGTSTANHRTVQHLHPPAPRTAMAPSHDASKNSDATLAELPTSHHSAAYPTSIRSPTKQKHTTAGIPAWSPTVVLICRF